MKCIVIGPRGGLATTDVSCDTCICATKCAFSGYNTRPWGCFDWVDIEGRRVAAEISVPADIEAADLPVEVAEATMEPDDAITPSYVVQDHEKVGGFDMEPDDE